MGVYFSTLWLKMAGNRQRSSRAQAPTSFHPVLENLEERTLLSVAASLPAAPLALGVDPLLTLQSANQATIQIPDAEGAWTYSPAGKWQANSGWAALGSQGTFVGPVADSSLLVAMADFNGDGNTDSAIASPKNGYVLVSGGVEGGFRSLPALPQSQVFFLAAGDFNGDRHADLTVVSRAVTQASQLTLQVFLGNGSGSFYSEVNLKTGAGVVFITVGSLNSNSSLTVGDLNGDGSTDILLSRFASEATTVNAILGNADRSFQQPSQFPVVTPGSFSLQFGTSQVLTLIPEFGQPIPAAPSESTPTILAVAPTASTSSDAATGTTVDSTPVIPVGAPVPPTAVEVPPPTESPPVGASAEASADGEPPISGPVLLDSFVEGTGLSVQVLVDFTALIGGADVSNFLTPEVIFWSQIDSGTNTAKEESRPSATGAAQETRIIAATQSAEAGGKTVAANASSSSAGADSTRSASIASKAIDLAEALSDETHETLIFDKGASLSGGWYPSLNQDPSVPATPPMSHADGAPAWPLENADTTLAPPQMLDGKLGFLLEIPGEINLGTNPSLNSQMSVPSNDRPETGRYSLLEMGQVVLSAMIVVKLTPGGPTDKAGVSGLVSSTDPLLRAAETAKEYSQFFSRLMRNIYQRYLGRDPEPGEDQGWVSMLLGGDTEENVLSVFLTTREFVKRAEALCDTGTPDEKYLQALYQLALDRAPTSSETATWLVGAKGPDRQHAALWLVRSNEFRMRQIDSMFRDVLQRAGTSAEIAGLAAMPLDLLKIRAALAAAAECDVANSAVDAASE